MALVCRLYVSFVEPGTGHKQLEAAISDYFKTEDTILYAACFDANGGLFEPLLTDEDAIISDALNHASIIDGVRLCRQNVIVMPMQTWLTWNAACRKLKAQRHRIIALLTVVLWTEMWLRWIKFVNWQKIRCVGNGRRIAFCRCSGSDRSWCG